jgi:hypothetical protein
VLTYVQRHQRMPSEVLRADVVDALIITDHLPAVIDKLRLAMMNLGGRAGLTLGDLAQPLHVANRQGAEAVKRRLEEAVHGSGVKDDKRGRAARSAQRSEARQLQGHGDALRAVARALLASQDLLPGDLADDAEELRGDADVRLTGTPPPAAFAARLRLLLRDLAAEPAGVPADLRPTLARAAELLGTD